MNNICTLLNNLSKNNTIMAQDLDDLECLISSVVKVELGDDSFILKESWVENNSPYIDFSFALKPGWLIDTPDDKQVKMRLSIDISDQSWYAYMVMDCENGECESWGEKEFNRGELETYGKPIQYMLTEIRQLYKKRLNEENAQVDNALKKALDVSKTLLEPHILEIRKICKEHGLTLYADHNIESSNCFRVVPDSIEPGELEEGQEEIPEDNIPYIDFGALSFDSSYDFFRKV